MHSHLQPEKGMPLWAKMLIGIALGVIVGYIISPHGAAMLAESTVDTLAPWIRLPGKIFLAVISMIVIPLVFVSITLALAESGSVSYLKRAGSAIALYFVGTTTIAVMIGVTIAGIIDPGSYIDPSLVEAAENAASNAPPPVVQDTPSIADMIVGLFPTNPGEAVVGKHMMQIVVGAIFFGIALLTMQAADSEPLRRLCHSVQEVCMTIVGWAMALAPVAVFSFLADLMIKFGIDSFIAMSAYMGSVLLGLVGLVVMYLVIVTVVARRNPWEFLGHIRNAQVLAFSTSSSAATMPLSLDTAENRLKVKPEIADFVVPLGTTINMDGTALYQMTAAIFLTQVFGISLDPQQIIVLAITIVGASIGSPGSPGVGLVILATIMHSIGVPPAGIALILGVDRLLDMCRTTVNVTGDLTATVVMDRWLDHKAEVLASE